MEARYPHRLSYYIYIYIYAVFIYCYLFLPGETCSRASYRRRRRRRTSRGVFTDLPFINESFGRARVSG